MNNSKIFFNIVNKEKKFKDEEYNINGDNRAINIFTIAPQYDTMLNSAISINILIRIGIRDTRVHVFDEKKYIKY